MVEILLFELWSYRSLLKNTKKYFSVKRAVLVDSGRYSCSLPHLPDRDYPRASVIVHVLQGNPPPPPRQRLPKGLRHSSCVTR